jgi:quinohemoprotein ethanol dehydrogenase
MNWIPTFLRRAPLPAVLLLGGANITQGAQPNLTAGDDRIADEREANDWLAYGRTHNERRFSPLTDINAGNVGTLKPHWFLDLPNDVGLTSTPLVIDGTLYFVGSMNRVRAVDAVAGRLIWEFDPEVAKEIAGRRQVGMMHNRGISFSKGKIFTATWDGRLIALDAKNGRPIWTTRTFPANEALYLTGAPKAFKDKVLIGNGGTEAGPTRGYVTAYDAETGRQAWKFFIVPGNPADGFEDEAMAMAAKTWTGEWWKHGGGGNVWHGFTYDAELDTLYIGTGNGAPWNRKIRSPGGGDNLFLCSIVALNPDTGKYKWHYQTAPGETWDYNSNMDIVLADIPVGGSRPIKAILHAPKNGFFYVIDRTTGKLISAEPFVKTNWASRIDLETGRPVEIRAARYETGTADVWPGTLGAHNWHGMAYSPATGLAYLPTDHRGTTFDDRGIDLANWRGRPFDGRVTGVNGSDLPPMEPGQSQGSLLAWDPVRQKQAWSVPLQNGWNSGTLATAGNLVFHGRATGQLVAHDARTGKELWSFDAGLGISSPPITYKVGDTQYIAVLVGFGGAGGGSRGIELGWQYGVHTRRLVAFSLQGKAAVPKQPPPSFAVPLTPADFTVNESYAAEGARLYQNCSTCHGGGAVAGAMGPDLRASPIFLDQGALAQVLRDGVRAPRGMPVFPDFTDEQLRALTHYVRKMAKEAKPVTRPAPR